MIVISEHVIFTTAHLSHNSCSSFLAFVDAVSLGCYFYLYHRYLRISLLSINDLQDGFSTRDQCKMGFSLWLVVASSCIDVVTFLILIVGIMRRGKTRVSFGKKSKQEIEPSVRPRDGPVMMMY